MFKYQDTGRMSELGEKQVKVVVKSRSKTYENLVKDYKGNVIIDKKTNQPLTKITKGTEIVKEVVADPKGPNRRNV